MEYIKPKHKFERTGSVDPNTAYYIELDNVVNEDNQDLETILNNGRYFSIFAPRQSGKTTYFKRFSEKLDKNKKNIPMLLSFQQYQELMKTEFYENLQEKIYEQLLIRLKEVRSKKLKNVKKLLKNHILKNNVDFGKLFEKLNTIIPEERIVMFIDKEQSLLLTHGLIKEKNKKAVVANQIYKKRFTNTFLEGADAIADLSRKKYYYQDGSLNFENILTDFNEYIMRIGVNAFYKSGKPLERTGQFLLTAWLYQFVKHGKGDLHYETPTGLGRMDILLTYNGIKYIIETKINRSRLDTTLIDAIEQVTEKYLDPERVSHGYVVIFDTKSKTGALFDTKQHKINDKIITSLVIAIGKS